MNDINRVGVVLLASTVVILATVVILLAWTEYSGSVNMLGDLANYLSAHSANPAKLIITLSALTIAVVAILVIVIELSPSQGEKELIVKQGDTTTAIPDGTIRPRLETALLTLPAVTKANVNLSPQQNGITATLELTVLPKANVAAVSQEAISALAKILQETELLLSEAPRLNITFDKGITVDSGLHHESTQGSNAGDQSS